MQLDAVPTHTHATLVEEEVEPGSVPSPGEISFRITLRDGCEELVTGADAYQQEHSMTTFFRTEGRRTVDCWSVRIASFRTDQILAVRRLEPASRRHLRPA